MTPNSDHSLTTADLAKADVAKTDEMRGRGDEAIVGRAAITDDDRTAAVAATAPPNSAPAKVDPAGNRRGNAPEHVALFADHEAADLRKRWSDVQTGFVDEPRRAVEAADHLVADVMKRLAEGFAAERTTLEHQWDRGDSVTTEDLRVALQRYRAFFDRLLSF
jgi:hypothetical protein